MTQKIDTGSLAIVGGIAIPYMATKDNLLRFIISAIIMAIYIGTIIAISKRKQELWGGIFVVFMTVGCFGLIHLHNGYLDSTARKNYILFKCSPSGLTTEIPYEDVYVEVKLYDCYVDGRSVLMTYDQLSRY